MSFAVIQTGGKQYLVKPGDKLRVEKLIVPEKGKILNFEEVLLIVKDDQKGIKLGNPFVKGVKVKAEFLNNGRSKKIVIRKYKAKTRYRKVQGHRQHYSEVLIKDF